jgi:hypothetical protein
MQPDERSSAASEQPTRTGKPPKRKSWRLWALVGFCVLAAGFYLFVQLDRSSVEPFGQMVVGLHYLFNRDPSVPPPASQAGVNFVKEMKSLGADATVTVNRPGFLATIGQSEWWKVTINNSAFDDAALARLADRYGARIQALELENTAVTDAGLRSLSDFTALRHLKIRDDRDRNREENSKLPPKISDDGIVHLTGLDRLWQLNLSDLPITDRGLAAFNDAPELMSLNLNHTKIQGHSFASLTSLPQLSVLYLDGTAMSDDGLKSLSGATALQDLSLKQVPLTPSAMPFLKAIPNVLQMDLTGCGLSNEDVADLIKSKPRLKVVRD